MFDRFFDTKRIYFLALTAFISAFVVSSCGMYTAGQNQTGSLSFGVNWDVPAGAKTKGGSRAASINCTSLNVSKVMASVADFNNNVLAVGGPFSCANGSGIISGVPSGSGYTVIFQGISTGNAVVYQGVKPNVSVTPGPTVDVGTITAAPVTTFVPPISVSNVGSSVANVIAATPTVATTGTATSGSTTPGTSTPAASNTSTNTGTNTNTNTNAVVTPTCPAGQTGTYPNCTNIILAPSAPSGLSVSSGNGQVSVNWNAVNEATNYEIYYSTSPGITTTNGTDVYFTSTNGTVTGLVNGTTYYFIVTALNSGGESIASYPVSAIPQVPAPGSPAGLTATSGIGQATVGWTAVSGATSYNLYYGTSSGVTTANGTKVTGATSGAAITGLVNGTTYFFIVTAVNSGVESSASSQASATPLAPPGTPAGLSATAGNAQVVLSWASVTGAISYNVYYRTASGVTVSNGTKLQGVIPGNSVSGLANGTKYYFVVTAVNAAGESAVSGEVSATPVAPAPGAPTGVTATAGNAQATVGWTAVSGATSYNVYYGTASGLTTTNGTKVTGAISGGSITGLVNGTAYYFIVTAASSGLEGSASSPVVSATPVAPAPGAPTGVTVTAGNAQAMVGWTAVSGATSYNVYYSTSSSVTTSNGTKVAGAVSGGTITGLVNGTTYYFIVTAVSSGLESMASSPAVGATPAAPAAPGAPTGVTATAGNAQATVGWTAVSGATSYNIYYGTTSGVTTANGTMVAGAVSGGKITGLVNGTKYYFIVTAVSSGLESLASSPAVGATPNATYADNGNGTIYEYSTNLTWQKIDDGILRNQSGAAAYCAGLSLGGYSSGWRLPVSDDLTNLVKTSLSPMIDQTYFPLSSAALGNYAGFWSSTVSATDSTKGNVMYYIVPNPVYTQPDNATAVVPKTTPASTRCVRG